MKKNVSLLLLLICLAGFLYGLVELFNWRFQSGDIYPPYSSLRADPLGASAFYESLSRIPGITVRRDFQMTDKLPDGKNITYLQMGGSQYDWRELSKSSFGEVDSFLHRGGRLVILYFPENEKKWNSTTVDDDQPKDEKKDKPIPVSKKKKKKKHHDLKDTVDDWVQLTNRWGFDVKLKPLDKSIEDFYDLVQVERHDAPELPELVSWHSSLVFTNLNKAWRVLYLRADNPVMIERKFGSGSVVLATDSYFISNEAMQKERHAALLAWLAGSSKEIVFDEAHFGIVDRSGVATLIRQYRLHGLVLGLLLLAGLFIWKNSASLAPRHAEIEAEGFVLGKDSASGFVNLLRRHVAPRDILDVCFTEWKKSYARANRPDNRLARIQKVVDAEQALPAKNRNPIMAYRAISRALKEKNRFKRPQNRFQTQPVNL